MNFNKYNPYLILTFGVMIISWSPLLTAWSDASGVITSFYRILIATIVLFIPFYRKRRNPTSTNTQNILLAVFAGVAFALDNALWSTGVTMAGASNPTFLVNTAPIWVGLGAMLVFKEYLSKQFWLGLVLAILGAALILEVDWRQSLESGTGSLYGLIGGLFYALFFLIGQKVRYHMDTISFFWIVVASASCTLGLIALMFGHSFTGYSVSTYIIFVVLGLVMQVGGWLAITYALGKLPAAIVAPILLGQPVIAAVLAHYMLQERLDHMQIAGAAAVLVGVLFTQRARIISPDVTNN
jgi:drug/metabolite transporter (DMT)-like permease